MRFDVPDAGRDEYFEMGIWKTRIGKARSQLGGERDDAIFPVAAAATELSVETLIGPHLRHGGGVEEGGRQLIPASILMLNPGNIIV